MLGPRYRIRGLEPADLEHLWTMQWDPLPREISAFYLLCAIGRARFCSVVEDETGRILAVLLATAHEDHLWVYVNHLRVEPECRQTGLGTELMRNLEAQCAAAGIGLIWLMTSADVEPFYGRIGYVRDASFLPPVARQLVAKHRPQSLVLSKKL